MVEFGQDNLNKTDDLLNFSASNSSFVSFGVSREHFLEMAFIADVFRVSPLLLTDFFPFR